MWSHRNKGVFMKKWILTALFASFCTSLAWGHPTRYSHTHNRDQFRTPHRGHHHHREKNQRKLRRRANRQPTRQLNNYYTIHNHSHYDHGHSYPICTQYGCHTPCNYHLHTCPLITANVIFPVLPVWFTVNIQDSLFYTCQNQYQWCLWNTPIYLQGACANQYFFCTGYIPYPYYPY